MKATIQTKFGMRILDLNRRRAIREKCLNCSNWVNEHVKTCVFTTDYPTRNRCSLWPYRMGTGKQSAKHRNNAIREYCLWCMVGARSEIPKCTSVNCALFNFRLGAKRKMAGSAGKTSPASDFEDKNGERIAEARG